jgi:hypothetical protein
MVGKSLALPGARRIAERAVAEGHWAGNHTLSHGSPLGLSGDAATAEKEILGMQEAMSGLTDGTCYFRPNGRGLLGPHLLNPYAVELLERIQATMVLWNSVPKDRKVDVPTSHAWVEHAKRDVLQNEWTLMVLHDRPSGHDDPGPMAHLGAFLEWARGAEVEIVQEFPDSCIAMREGRLRPWATQFVSTPGDGPGAPDDRPAPPGRAQDRSGRPVRRT